MVNEFPQHQPLKKDLDCKPESTRLTSLWVTNTYTQCGVWSIVAARLNIYWVNVFFLNLSRSLPHPPDVWSHLTDTMFALRRISLGHGPVSGWWVMIMIHWERTDALKRGQMLGMNTSYQGLTRAASQWEQFLKQRCVSTSWSPGVCPPEQLPRVPDVPWVAGPRG